MLLEMELDFENTQQGSFWAKLKFPLFVMITATLVGNPPICGAV